jgi:beta-galactosidase
VRTVITVCGEMRGVGGIDTWGSDVEEAYHVPSHRDIEFSFRMF